jgi:hypothetical protein
MKSSHQQMQGSWLMFAGGLRGECTSDSKHLFLACVHSPDWRKLHQHRQPIVWTLLL